MKTKIQVLAMMFIAAMAFGACDDDDKNDNIKAPDAVSKALKDKYPAAMDIEWERKGDYFVADCWMDGREMDVWYDVQATWKLTETDILWEGLPRLRYRPLSKAENMRSGDGKILICLNIPYSLSSMLSKWREVMRSISCSMPETVIYCRNVM